jgi:hypothetical protein
MHYLPRPTSTTSLFALISAFFFRDIFSIFAFYVVTCNLDHLDHPSTTPAGPLPFFLPVSTFFIPLFNVLVLVDPRFGGDKGRGATSKVHSPVFFFPINVNVYIPLFGIRSVLSETRLRSYGRWKFAMMRSVMTQRSLGPGSRRAPGITEINNDLDCLIWGTAARSRGYCKSHATHV